MATEREMIAAYNRTKSQHAAAKECGVKRWQVRAALLRQQGSPQGRSQFSRLDAARATAEHLGPRIRTLDDLLRLCEVDMTRWEVERYVVNKWEQASKEKAGGVHIEPLIQVKAWLKRTPHGEAADMLEMFRDMVKGHTPTGWRQRPVTSTAGALYEVDVFDLHTGRLAWGKETGHGDYDSDIARRLCLAAYDDLLARVDRRQVAQVVIPIGNDFYNVDGMAGTTTAGTPQDEDGRWQRSFRAGCQLAAEVIERSATIAPVLVPIVPGNHDAERAFYLGEVLSAWFARNDRVTVNNEPTARKYYQHGAVLLAWSHGKAEKDRDLPLIMATERPAEWAATKYREWHCGHTHHESNDDHGVRVRHIQSLAAPCTWTASVGLVGSLRGAQAFLFDRDRGLLANYHHNL